MVIDTAQLDTDFGNIISEMPTGFTFAGSVYVGLLTDLTTSRVLEPGGFDSDFQGELYAQQSSFVVQPTAGITLSIGATSYRAHSVKKSPDGVGLVMELISTNK